MSKRTSILFRVRGSTEAEKLKDHAEKKEKKIINVSCSFFWTCKQSCALTGLPCGSNEKWRDMANRESTDAADTCMNTDNRKCVQPDGAS